MVVFNSRIVSKYAPNVEYDGSVKVQEMYPNYPRNADSGIVRGMYQIAHKCKIQMVTLKFEECIKISQKL